MPPFPFIIDAIVLLFNYHENLHYFACLPSVVILKLWIIGDKAETR